MPSYTFVSTANAFALRGAVPVFVDIREDTLNLDERLVEAAITPKTRAICVVHYAGVACEMDAFVDIAERHGLMLIEDAAQGILSTYRGKPLGTLGNLGALSFHETKNIISGEGGALLCRDVDLAERAEIIREKGTNRSRFFRGQVDKYTWVDLGSSFLPGEITAAFLKGQMDAADDITARRMAIWERYHDWAASHEAAGRLRRPHVPAHCTHNAHMYYLLLPNLETRTAFIGALRERGVQSVFHYIPLHSSPAGRSVARAHGSLEVTDRVSDCLVRLPLWVGLESVLPRVLEAADDVLSSQPSRIG
jgi:dTDP-4-amino-4,6-dideoxygalactose transaminase